MPTENAQLLEIAKRSAVKAGKVILDIYNSGDFTSFQKEDDSPVTTADYKANEVIMDILLKETPDIPVMSEESECGPLSERKNWQRYWLLDPIDGTQEFIARSGDFAVNIALIENNVPVIGVIYWPAGDALYYAIRGQGAFKESPSETKQIHVRPFKDVDKDVVMIAISRRQAREKVMNCMNIERIYQSVPLGSCSLKACFIAEGKADVFIRFGITGEWDTGASQCIVTEAGGSILAHDFTPLSYNQREELTNPDFIVMGDQNVNWTSIVKYRKGE
ncbi:3'(2'),5'-bisphosphate nucleotidase CysQ [Paraglaciecola aquimarina]|uniref:3'(2'),5'-bisphosphate nucleotidase CysQ n=1 Tax=Paraglaciecola aquimarina TaxID=1235557 RepID=A0ABU3ST95_9ALTE|nr:3'(2'),5'-bisphosphate nucleotidase CysQ [Paraglaciecola aquimarina]MDU0353233.1 3'(2'),5'-bisphosphate nucleotidase CysQ [Paraglaciecola aquimarina]